MATPSVNRRKDVFGGLSGPSRTFNVASEANEIPSSSAFQVVSCTPKASDCATNGPSRQLSAVHEQTPTRGPLKLIESRSNLSSTGNQPEFGGRPSGMLSDARDGIPFLNKRDAKHLPPFPSGSFRTPTKVCPIDPQRNNSHEGIEDTPIKVPQGQGKPTSLKAPNENSVSIYDSLGWNDDFDELS